MAAKKSKLNRSEISTLASRCHNVLQYQLLTDVPICLNDLVREKNYKNEAGDKIETFSALIESILSFQDVEEGPPEHLYYARGYTSRHAGVMSTYDEDNPIKASEISVYTLQKKDSE